MCRALHARHSLCRHRSLGEAFYEHAASEPTPDDLHRAGPMNHKQLSLPSYTLSLLLRLTSITSATVPARRMPKLTTRHMRITLFSSLLTAIFMSTADAGPVSTRAADLNSCLSNAGLSPVTQSSVSYKSDTAGMRISFFPVKIPQLNPLSPDSLQPALATHSSGIHQASNTCRD